MSQEENSERTVKKDGKMAVISLVSLLIVLLSFIEIYEIINDPNNLIAMGTLGVFILAAVYVETVLIRRVSERKIKDQEEAFNNVFRSEKASYLLLRKYFDQMDQKMEMIEKKSAVPYQDLVNAQKALAKVQINRNKENSDAFKRSNDKVIQRMMNFQKILEDSTKGGISDQEKAAFMEGNKDILVKQQEILAGLKEMEASLRSEILESTNKITSIKTQPVMISQPQVQEQDSSELNPLDIEENFSLDHDLSVQPITGNSSESDLDNLLMEMDSITEEKLEPMEEEPELQPIMEEPELQPIMEEPELQPIIEEPELEPVMEEPELQPIAEEPELQPIMEEPELQPIAEKPELQPIVEEIELQPIMEESKLKSIMEEPELQPITEEPDLQPLDEELVIEPIMEESKPESIIEELVLDQINPEPVLEPITVEEPELGQINGEFAEPVKEEQIIEPIMMETEKEPDQTIMSDIPELDSGMILDGISEMSANTGLEQEAQQPQVGQETDSGMIIKELNFDQLTDTSNPEFNLEAGNSESIVEASEPEPIVEELEPEPMIETLELDAGPEPVKESELKADTPESELKSMINNLDIDKIFEEPDTDMKSDMPELSEIDNVMNAEEIAALIANTDSFSEPEPEVTATPNLSDPGHVMNADEIAALLANL